MNYLLFDPGKKESVRVRSAKLVMLSVLAASLMAGCDDDSSKSGNNNDEQCTEDLQCADREDGNTKCNVETGECVKPEEKPNTPKCGNDVIEVGEVCDKSQLNGKKCESWSEYIGGSLACNNSCEYDKSGCFECTYSDLSRCKSGQKCSNGVCVDKDHVIACGDNLVEGDEDCDGTNLRDKTCADIRGYVDGELKCTSCVYDTSSCVECTEDIPCSNNKTCQNGVCVEPAVACGDGILAPGESCDGTNLAGKKCESWPEFIGGDLACNNSCEFNKSGCYECTDKDLSKCGKDQICSNGHCVDKGHVITCGDGIVEGSEACDKNELNGKTCADFKGFADGELKCSGKCEFDTGACVECSSDAHCANNADGKVKCESNVCVKPTVVSKPKVVISQVYPGAGLKGSIFKTKYIELFNRGDEAVDITNWVIQYGAADADKIASSCELTDKYSLPAGGYYLVAITALSSGEVSDFPKVDHVCSKTMSVSASKGKFFLVNGEKLTTSVPKSGYVDAIGYGGDGVNWHEGASAAPALSNETAALRNNGGCDDTDDNGADFTAGKPAPRNSSTTRRDCSIPNEPEDNAKACSDKIDNDGDGLIDCADDGCQKLDVCMGPENTEAACSDKWDNDGNGKIDCDDSSCQSLKICQTPENTLETCSDKWDNDGDGKIDCDDSDCADFCKKCGDNQTYIAKYDLCAHNINNAKEFTTFRDTWNANGEGEYILEEGKPAAFILTGNVALGSIDWVGIGTNEKPFNGMFFGNNQKITGLLTSQGVFGTVEKGTIEDLDVRVNVKPASTELTVGGVVLVCKDCTLNNVSYTGTINAQYLGGLVGNGYGKFNNVSVDVTTNNNYPIGWVGGLISRVDGGNLTIQNANVKTNFASTYYESQYYSSDLAWGGMIGIINSNKLKVSISKSTVDVTAKANIRKESTSYVYHRYGGLVALNYGTLEVDHVQITNNVEFNIRSYYDDSDYFRSYTFMGGIVGDNNEGVFNNIKVIINKFDSSSDGCYGSSTKCHYTYKGQLFSKTGKSEITNVSLHNNTKINVGTEQYIVYDGKQLNLINFNLVSALKTFRFNTLANSLIINSRVGKLNTGGSNVLFDTVVYDSISTSSAFSVSNGSEYSTPETTVDIMNKSLESKNPYLLDGKYNPWHVTNEGYADINLDAADSALYPIP